MKRINRTYLMPIAVMQAKPYFIGKRHHPRQKTGGCIAPNSGSAGNHGAPIVNSAEIVEQYPVQCLIRQSVGVCGLSCVLPGFKLIVIGCPARQIPAVNMNFNRVHHGIQQLFRFGSLAETRTNQITQANKSIEAAIKDMAILAARISLKTVARLAGGPANRPSATPRSSQSAAALAQSA